LIVALIQWLLVAPKVSTRVKLASTLPLDAAGNSLVAALRLTRSVS
jgi:hypothetical protein